MTARRRSAMLSLAAAGVTGALLVWAILHNSGASTAWRLSLFTIAAPVIVLSIAANIQYRRGHSSGAGAAAAAVYWVLFVVLFFAAAPLYFFGGLLQTVAWFISRPRKARSEIDVSLSS